MRAKAVIKRRAVVCLNCGHRYFSAVPNPKCGNCGARRVVNKEDIQPEIKRLKNLLRELRRIK